MSANVETLRSTGFVYVNTFFCDFTQRLETMPESPGGGDCHNPVTTIKCNWLDSGYMFKIIKKKQFVKC